MGVILPALAGTRPAKGQSQCISNLRRLMLASQLYARDNSDYLPHPTWGGDMTGYDGWAYATENKGRLPNSPRAPIPFKRDSQLPFREIGQLWNYIQSGSAYECPEDFIVRQPTPTSQSLFKSRPVQITSYNFSGMIQGNPYLQALAGSLTYKLSRFLPTDIITIEPSEHNSFNFNDAGFNPEAEVETARHGGSPITTGQSPVEWLQEAGGNVGRIDGGAEFMSQSAFNLERGQISDSRRNRIRCYPWK